MTNRITPRWKRAVLWLNSVRLYWEFEKPLRVALDRGDIDVNEYDRRRWECDYYSIPSRSKS